MKNLKLLMVLTLCLFIGACGVDSAGGDLKQVEARDYSPQTEQILVDTTGDFSIKGFNAKGQGTYLTVKDTTWQKVVNVPKVVYFIRMTPEQVGKYSKEVNYWTTDFLLGCAMLLLVVILTYFALKNDWFKSWGKGGSIGLAYLVAISITVRTYQKVPSELAGNNLKQLSRAEYNERVKTDPNFDAFWQEKWDNNELVTITNKKSLWK
jgi:hypothetical protein